LTIVRQPQGRAASASVNFTQVLLSCRHSQPRVMARSIPARKSSPVPPAARKGALTPSIVDTTTLHCLDAVRDLDQLFVSFFDPNDLR
jgi:hypothetical protein